MHTVTLFGLKAKPQVGFKKDKGISMLCLLFLDIFWASTSFGFAVGVPFIFGIAFLFKK